MTEIVEEIARAITPELWVDIDRWRATAKCYRETLPAEAGFQDSDGAEAAAVDRERKADKYAEISLAKARAAYEVMARSDGWLPIESAPKDGTPLLLFARCKTATAPVAVVGWCYGQASGEWLESCFVPNEQVGIIPTHWRPLPDPPSTIKELPHD